VISSDALPLPGSVPALATVGALAEWFGVSGRTILNWTKLGILPEPVRLSPRKRLYRVEEVREHLKKLEQERWTINVGESNGKAF